jgi:hypothetical protein
LAFVRFCLAFSKRQSCGRGAAARRPPEIKTAVPCIPKLIKRRITFLDWSTCHPTDKSTEVHTYWMQRSNVILKMCPFPEDEAIQSTREHAACTNWVRTKQRDFETLMIPRKHVFFVYSQNDPNNPKVNNPRPDFLSFWHSRVAFGQNLNPTRFAARFGSFNPEISGCSPG